jgi:hypothetical protein
MQGVERLNQSFPTNKRVIFVMRHELLPNILKLSIHPLKPIGLIDLKVIDEYHKLNSTINPL